MNRCRAARRRAPPDPAARLRYAGVTVSPLGSRLLSIVIPTLDAVAELARTLPVLTAAAPAAEIVVADGGSGEGTAALARRLGARVVTAPPGRGAQLAAGTAAAGGDWLLFLHADTLPAPGWERAVARFAADPANARRAAAFRFALDDSSAAARRLEALVAARCRLLALPYGDQGLLIARTFLDALGGFRPLALMEDVDLVRRIGRRRLVLLDVPAVTSAKRYRAEGYLRRGLRNALCLTLYGLGVPPDVIVRIYR